MKLSMQKLALILLLLILTLFILELSLRPKVLSQSWAELLQQFRQYPLAEKVYERNYHKGDAIAAANLAKSRYKQGRFQDSVEPAEYAVNHEDSNAEMSYDRANIAYRNNDYDTALKNYRKSMLANPQDMDAKANYELTLAKLDKQTPPPPPEPKPDEKKKEDIRNILSGLDNKESSDRKQEQKKSGATGGKWW